MPRRRILVHPDAAVWHAASTPDPAPFRRGVQGCAAEGLPRARNSGFNRNWGVGEPCANAWHGIGCAGGRVVEVAINLNNVACRGKLNVTVWRSPPCADQKLMAPWRPDDGLAMAI